MPKTRRTLAFALAAFGASAHAAIAPPVAPPAITPSPAEEAAFMLTASGVHIFHCKAAGGRFAWTFVAPDATLYEAGVRSIGTHNVPNLFESTSDRSSVSGVVRATQPAGENLPWALLRAVPTSTTGMFAGVTSIQRVNTSGGAAPVSGCDAGNEGAEARVNFQADYYFYKPRGAA